MRTLGYDLQALGLEQVRDSSISNGRVSYANFLLDIVSQYQMQGKSFEGATYARLHQSRPVPHQSSPGKPDSLSPELKEKLANLSAISSERSTSQTSPSSATETSPHNHVMFAAVSVFFLLCAVLIFAVSTKQRPTSVSKNSASIRMLRRL